MYEAFFGFQSRPFTAAPKTNLYFPAGAIEHARQTLSRSVERADGVAVVVGPAGTGKSLLLSLLAEQYRNQFHVATLASARLCTRRALLQNILFELKLPYRNMEEGELRLSLIDHLEPETSTGMLLLIDEAHTLPMRLLEEVRMITNLVRDGEPRVRLVLAGTRSLEERLSHPKLDSLNQRVAARCFLEALSGEETREMVRRQIQTVGGVDQEVFTEDALTAIHQATDGVPRLINQVADHALMLAAVGGVKRVNADGVSEAWADLQQLPLPWNAANPKREESTIEFGAGGENSLLSDSLLSDSLLSDALFEDTSIEVEDFQPAAAEETEQVELRLAPLPVDEQADSIETSSAIEEDVAERVDEVEKSIAELDAMEEETTTSGIAGMDASSEGEALLLTGLEFAAAAPIEAAVPEESEDDLPEPATLSIESAVETTGRLTGESAPLDVHDDPFDEVFEAEEIVIESRDIDFTPRIKVDGGPLASEIAELMAEPTEKTQGWTIDIEAVEVAPIVEVAQADTVDSSFVAEKIITADLILDELVAAGQTLESKPEAIADEEETDLLADQDEWEPAFPAIAPEQTRSLTSDAEPRLTVEAKDEGELLIDDGDLIIVEDEEPVRSGAPAPKARAVVRDYRRLFAQLRRG